MNPGTAKAPTDRPTCSDPNPRLYGFPLAAWRIPLAEMPSPLSARIYGEAYEVLTDPDGRTADLWAAEIEDEGYRALTASLTLPQVVSLVSELPQRTIVRITGRAPSDKARQEVVRALYAPAED